MKLELAKTMRSYKKENIIKDVITGIIIMAVSIPISMGYAQIAGLPAVYGLYGSVFPIIMFALLSTSPQFVFGVDAAPAALVGSALIGFGIESGSDKALKAVSLITFFVAVWLLAFYIMKAESLSITYQLLLWRFHYGDMYYNNIDAASKITWRFCRDR